MTNNLKDRISSLEAEWRRYSDVKYSPDIMFNDLMDFTIEKLWLKEQVEYLVRAGESLNLVANTVLVKQLEQETEKFESRFDTFKSKVVLELIHHGDNQ